MGQSLIISVFLQSAPAHLIYPCPCPLLLWLWSLHLPEAKNASSLHTSCTHTIKPKQSTPSLWLNTVFLGRPSFRFVISTAKLTCRNKLLTTNQQHCCFLQYLGNKTYFVPLNFLKHVQVSGVRDAPMYNEDFLVNQGGEGQPTEDILNHLQDFLPMHLEGQVRKEKMKHQAFKVHVSRGKGDTNIGLPCISALLPWWNHN